MTVARKLGLGTVQLGIEYGITNRSGRTPEEEAGAILNSARNAGICMLDTAPLYGASESVLGRWVGHLPDVAVVTKTEKFSGSSSGSDARARLRAEFSRSLARLRRTSLYGLLLHDADDLMGPLGPALWAEMTELKEQGLVRRIGISVYDGCQIDAALAAYPLDLVQLPYNPLDRRLEEGGQLARLAAAKVEVHARSLFLQGLLLQDADLLPPRLAPLHGPIAELHAQIADRGMARLEGVLALCFQEQAIDRFIVGATSASELQEIVFAAEKAETLRRSWRFASSRTIETRYLNPACWAKLG